MANPNNGISIQHLLSPRYLLPTVTDKLNPSIHSPLLYNPLSSLYLSIYTGSPPYLKYQNT